MIVMFCVMVVELGGGGGGGGGGGHRAWNNGTSRRLKVFYASE